MPWARLDDGFHDHPKVDGLSLAAVGLYTLCLTWAHRHRKTAVIPGHITEARVSKVAGKQGPALARELEVARLWDAEVNIGGWVIHDFTEYLPKERDPEERREAGRKGAARRWSADSKADGNLPGESLANDGSRGSARAPRPVPDPSQPDVQPGCVVDVNSRTAPGDAQISAHHEDPTARLLIEHVNAYPDPLTPSQTAPWRTAIAQQVAEGVDPDRIKAGLARTRERNLSARMLPECVVEATARPKRPSTTEAAVAAGLELVARFEDRR